MVFDPDSGTETVQRQRVRIKRPKHYRVVLLNDDYTSMEFVVLVLETVFQKNPAEAVQIMMHVHRRGRGVCGVYTKEIAEAKVTQVHQLAREREYPLRCVMEEV